jgi:hypothetical protein
MSPRLPWERPHKPIPAQEPEEIVDSHEYRQALEVLSRMRQGASLTQASLALARPRHHSTQREALRRQRP